MPQSDARLVRLNASYTRILISNSTHFTVSPCFAPACLILLCMIYCAVSTCSGRTSPPANSSPASTPGSFLLLTATSTLSSVRTPFGTSFFITSVGFTLILTSAVAAPWTLSSFIPSSYPKPSPLESQMISCLPRRVTPLWLRQSTTLSRSIMITF